MPIYVGNENDVAANKKFVTHTPVTPKGSFWAHLKIILPVTGQMGKHIKKLAKNLTKKLLGSLWVKIFSIFISKYLKWNEIFLFQVVQVDTIDNMKLKSQDWGHLSIQYRAVIGVFCACVIDLLRAVEGSNNPGTVFLHAGLQRQSGLINM